MKKDGSYGVAATKAGLINPYICSDPNVGFAYALELIPFPPMSYVQSGVLVLDRKRFISS